jgi:hypothetical protein
MTVDPSGCVSVSAAPFPFNLCSFLNNQPAVPKDELITETIVLDSPIGESGENEGETNLSPRLTHYMDEGIVPESPMVKSIPVPLNSDSPGAMGSQLKGIAIEMNRKLYTPLVNHTRESSSDDWRVMSGNGASSSVKRPPKYRRLRKLGEAVKRHMCPDLEENCEGILGKQERCTDLEENCKGILGKQERCADLEENCESILRKREICADRAILNEKQAVKGSRSFPFSMLP